MGNPLDWRRAKQAGKPTIDVVDEVDHRDKDAAARWLKQHDPVELKKLGRRPHRRLLKPSERKAVGIPVSDAKNRPQ